MKKTHIIVMLTLLSLALTACDTNVNVPGVGNIDLGNSNIADAAGSQLTEYVNNAIDGAVQDAKDKIRDKVNETINDTINDTLSDFGLNNPWVLSTNQEIKEKSGNEFVIPEGATKVMFFYAESLGIAQMQYTLGGISYSARIANSTEMTDISGMHYEWPEDNCGMPDTIDRYGIPGEARYCKDGEKIAMRVLWFDEKNGKIYSLSAVGDGVSPSVPSEKIFK